jgi:hypothetical protein
VSEENDDDVQVIHIDFGPRVDERYIGDGVYASHDIFHIWLRTGDGNDQQIALDPSVYRALVEYAKHIGMEKRP